MNTVVLVGNKPKIAGLIQTGALTWPMQVSLTVCKTPEQNLNLMEHTTPLLVVFYPDAFPGAGTMFLEETIFRFRQVSRQVPLIVMCERHESDASRAVAALLSGADDYIRLPCDPDEISIRMRRIITTTAPGVLPREDDEYSDNREPLSRELLRDLGPIARRLLRRLASDPFRIHSKEELIKDIWGMECNEKTKRLLRHYIWRLKRRTSNAWILNLKGMGYLWLGPPVPK